MGKIKVELSQAEVDMIIWELQQGQTGDNSQYDKKLGRIISKLKSE